MSTPTPFDLCAQEPIHLPGAIQPHGVLLVLEEPSLSIATVSASAEAWLGLLPKSLLGQPLAALLPEAEVAVLLTALVAPDPAQFSPLPLRWAGRTFDALLHRHAGRLILELEPTHPQAENLARQHRQLQSFITAVQSAPTLAESHQVTARAVAELTGFERVMVYRFDADWHGEVVGEHLSAEVDSYFGLHFPASDIPAQARALYEQSWLRLIPTVDYLPAPLLAEPALAAAGPVDLSFAVLRSVSPIHLEYLRNMQVGASMSISILVEGRLWGLIACHHRQARYLPFSVRAACELLGQAISREIALKQELLSLRARAEVNTIQTRFFELIAREENVSEALLRYTPALLEFMRARGAALCFGEQCHLVGQTPSRQEVAALLDWLSADSASPPVFATGELQACWPPGEAMQDVASGLLAVKLSRVEPHFVLWFRPEVVTTVTWAGNPEKPMEAGLRLHPRKSFSAWRETVRGRSLPWLPAEVDGAHELRVALNALVIRRTERLLRLNSELERKNTDLNSFAYIASHDLKEPLRGISHFARFLAEDHGEVLGPEGMRKVETISTLATQTNELLLSLGRFSEIGRIELTLRETNLQKVVDDVLTSVRVRLEESRVEVRRPVTLPITRADPVLMREVFANLITNACKYNDKPWKWVEISVRPPAEGSEGSGPVLTVSDNGIGLRDRNLLSVFQMFRRLHKDRFGPGTGAGLAIVKSIVERHGGRVWIESVFGEGSTFCFTLA